MGSFDFDHGILQAVSQSLVQKRPRGRPKKLSLEPPTNGNVGAGRGDHCDKTFEATEPDYYHHNQQSVSGADLERRVRVRKAAPLPLLREWALVACRRGDCGLLGRALLLAHSGGLSLSNVLESSATSALEEGAASTLARDPTTTATVSVFGLARTPREHSQHQQEQQQQQCQGQASEEGVGERHNETISSTAHPPETSATSGSATTATMSVSSILEPLALPPSSLSSPTKPVLPESLSWLFHDAKELDVKGRQRGVPSRTRWLHGTKTVEEEEEEEEGEEQEEGGTPHSNNGDADGDDDYDDSDGDYGSDEWRKRKRRRHTGTCSTTAALMPSLPASSSTCPPTKEATALTLSPQPLVLVKVVTNGLPSFLVNPLFERFVMSREALSKKADHATPRQPSLGATTSDGGGSCGDGGDGSGACPSVVSDLDSGAGHSRGSKRDFVRKAGAFPSFLHPEDGLFVSELVGRLWKDLEPPSSASASTTTRPPASTLNAAASSSSACPHNTSSGQDNDGELSSTVELPPGRLRLWMKPPGTSARSPHQQGLRRQKEERNLSNSSNGSFVRCGGKLQLVVRTCGGRQTSFLAFAFWPLAAELAGLHRRSTKTNEEEEEGEAETAEWRAPSSSCSPELSPLPPTTSSDNVGDTLPTLSPSCEPDTPPVAAGRAQPCGDGRPAAFTAAATNSAESLWLSWDLFDDESLASELGGLLDL